MTEIITNTNKPELVEQSKTVHWRGIPTTEDELDANTPPSNADLPETLRSEAFDIE